MNEKTQEIRETTTQSGDTVQKNTQINDSTNDNERQSNVAERVIWLIDGILMVLLGFRFVLALLGANLSNSFASFIYNVSHPFVAPFFSLFNYRQNYGISHFEVYTLVAMVFYSVVAWGIVKIVTITKS